MTYGKNGLRAVIFDMDGLMFDTETLNMRCWIEAGKKHGYTITEDMCKMHIGANLAVTRRLMCDALGPAFDFDAVRADRIALAFEHIERNGMPEKAGLHEIMRWLADNGIKRAIATSSERRLIDFYSRHSADGIFAADAVITGDMVSRSKPEPDIFLKAAECLGVSPEECAVLEDSYNGIRAAHAAGMIPIMVPDLLPPTPEISALVHRITDSLNGAIAVLEELRDGR